MGTMLQGYGFDEAEFRGERFRDHPHDLRGDSDLLSLTQPDAVRAIHAGYLAAGADIVSTNTFTATRIAQADYGLDPRSSARSTSRPPGWRARRRTTPKRSTPRGRATSPARSARPTGPPRSARTSATRPRGA